MICCINVNNISTDWFQTYGGVIQGDTLSPTLFNVFRNDLVDDVNSLNLGITIDGHGISILLYADNIVLLGDTEKDLQKMLESVYKWNKKYKIKFNARKSSIVHFRNQWVPRSAYNCQLGETVLCTIEQYKYLGLVLNKFLDFNITAQVLSDAANRVLRSIINKYKAINGLGYYAYIRLFQSGVCPILDYGSEIWGFRHFDKVDSIQKKGIRIYIGVHRFTPIAAINGDMGWIHNSVKRKVVWFAFGTELLTLIHNAYLGNCQNGIYIVMVIHGAWI